MFKNNKKHSFAFKFFNKKKFLFQNFAFGANLKPISVSSPRKCSIKPSADNHYSIRAMLVNV